MGLLDTLLTGGGAADPYAGVLTPEQQSALRNQSMLAAGLQMMMASAGQAGQPRPRLGQILGQGFMAGTNTYQNNAKNIYDMGMAQEQRKLQQMQLQMAMAKAEREAQMRDAWMKLMGGGAVGAPASAPSAMPAPAAGGAPAAAALPVDGLANAQGGEQVMPAVPVNANATPSFLSRLTPDQRMLLAIMPPEEGVKTLVGESLKADSYDTLSESERKSRGLPPGQWQINFRTGELKSIAKPEYTAPQEVVIGGQRVLGMYDKDTQTWVPMTGATPAVPLPSEIGAVEYVTGRPLAGTGAAGMAEVKTYNESKSPKVNLTQDKSFERSMDLRKEFNGLKIVQGFAEVQTAYDQIRTALKNPSAANDLAAATKFMKMLDPGSVVRESELNMAMSATGYFDKITNYYNRLKTGQVLTESQRKDFYQAAEGLYRAAQERYNPIVEQYRGLAQQHGMDPNTVVRLPTAPVANPSMKQQGVKTYNPKTGKWE